MESKSVTIFLKNPIGKIISLTCPLNSTVEWIKEKIKDREAIASNNCYLTYCYKRLDEKNTLEDYNVQEHETISINIYLRGD